jgi:hypothetical protein
MTAEVKEAIVSMLERCFAPVSVARSLGISYECYRQHYNRDPDFKAAVEDARRIYTGLLHMEVHRRAVEGWTVPVFHQGRQVGTVRLYSDRLLVRHLARFDASYRVGSVVDRTARVGGRVERPCKSFERLPPDTQATVRAIARAACAPCGRRGVPEIRSRTEGARAGCPENEPDPRSDLAGDLLRSA